MRSFPFFAASLFLIACSGNSATTILEPLPDAGAADQDAQAVVDAAPSLDSAVDAAPKPGPIDPIAEGYEWSYDVKILGTYTLCQGGPQKGKVTGTTSFGGKSGFKLQSLCPKAGISDYAVTGDQVEVRVLEAGPWELALDAPVAEGHGWSNAYGTFAWHAIAPELVGGKSQPDCWQAKDVNGASYTNYCRGVGPTHWHIEDKGGNGYDAVLTGVNF